MSSYFGLGCLVTIGLWAVIAPPRDTMTWVIWGIVVCLLVWDENTG